MTDAEFQSSVLQALTAIQQKLEIHDERFDQLETKMEADLNGLKTFVTEFYIEFQTFKNTVTTEFKEFRQEFLEQIKGLRCEFIEQLQDFRQEVAVSFFDQREFDKTFFSETNSALSETVVKAKIYTDHRILSHERDYHHALNG